MLAEDVSQFVADQKTLNGHLMNFKKTLKDIVPIRQQEKLHYQEFARFLEGYETSRTSKTSNETGEMAHVKLIQGDNSLMEKLENMASQH